MATSDPAAAPADTPRRVTGALGSLFAAWGGVQEHVGSTEAQLQKRQRLGLGSVFASLAGLAVSVVGLLVDKDAAKSLTTLAEVARALRHGELAGPAVVVLAGLALFAGGAVLYVLLRWTRFLHAETREPFRYTVSIDEFKRAAKEAPACALDNEGRMALLNHDLRERLHQRIDRFSLLDAPPAAEAGARPAHLHVAGQYALRQDRRGQWHLQVMPTVRLGAANAPVAMAYTVMFPVDGELGAPHYEQLVERVYSSIATEIYRTIEADVRTKIRRFPTAYLRAVALYYEARDISRSNTVDAYDLALDLYRDARSAFEMAPWRDARRLWSRWPVVWAHAVRYLQMRSRVHIGDVRCQVYRHMTALQTGRRPNPIYECVWRMGDVIADLTWVHEELSEGGRSFSPQMAARAYFRFPADRFARWLWRRPSEQAFAELRRCLFDAHTVAALACSQLGAIVRADEHLKTAAAVDPALAAVDPVHLVALAQVELRQRQRSRLLRRATEMAPKFQLAQVQLAKTVELAFREEGGVTSAAEAGGRLRTVIQHYDEVLRLNPGNLAAIAAQGYLHWLIGDLGAAEQCFRDGLAFKTIVRDTATPELNYGLARVLAERGADDEAFDHYAQAMAAERDVAAWSTSVAGLSGSYYLYVDDALVGRYARFRRDVTERLGDAGGDEIVRKTILSFACNDHANVLLNSFFRNGRREHLDAACEALDAALEVAPNNAVAHFNRAQAREFLSGDEIALAVESIDRAAELAPRWLTARGRQAELTLSSATFDSLDNSVRLAEEDLRAARAAPLVALTGTRGPQGDGGTSQLEAEQARRRRVEQKEKRRNELRSRRDEMLESYDVRLKGLVDELTKDLRLRALLKPADEGADSQVWCDNWLPLVDDARMRWDQLDSADVAALSGLVRATVQRTLGRLGQTRRVLEKLPADDAERAPLEADQQRRRDELVRNLRLVDFLIDHFRQADLDLHLSSLDTTRALDLPERESVSSVITAAVRGWTYEDPAHYWLLNNWIGWMDRDATALAAETLLRDGADAQRMRQVALRLFVFGLYDPPPGARLRYGRLRELAERCVAAAADDAVSHYLHGVALDDAGAPADALPAFDRALALPPPAATGDKTLDELLTPAAMRERRRDTAARRFEELRDGGDLRGAIAVADEAIAADREDRGPAQQLLEIAERQPTRAERRRFAARALTVLRDRDVTELNADSALRLRALEAYDAREHRALHVVTPLVVDIASDVESLIVDAQLEMLPAANAEIDRMRAAVEAASGVRAPGVRFRPAPQLAAGQFVVAIDEIPVTLGRTRVGRTFWLGDADWQDEDADPLSGRRGGWLADDEPVPAVAAESCGALRFLLRQLERVVLDHRTSLFFRDELAARGVMPAEGIDRAPFVSALRGLLAEDVPIVDLRALSGCWAETAAPHDGAAAEALRRLPAVRAALPGNDGAHRLLALGPRFLQQVQQGLVGAPEPVLALDPDTCQALLAAVRIAQGAHEEPAALVVADAVLRPHVAALTRVEFPRLPVLAAAELSPRAAARVSEPVELEAAP